MALKKGDKVVCVCKNWENFTHHKVYELYLDFSGGSLLPVIADYGSKPLPSYDFPGGRYFIPLEEFREMKIEYLINHEDC